MNQIIIQTDKGFKGYNFPAFRKRLEIEKADRARRAKSFVYDTMKYLGIKELRDK